MSEACTVHRAEIRGRQSCMRQNLARQPDLPVAISLPQYPSRRFLIPVSARCSRRQGSIARQ